MNVKQYQIHAAEGLTEGTKNNMLEVFGLGIGGEAGEVQDIIKKWYAKNKETPIDIQHIGEELGDVLWYVANLCNYFHLDMSEIMETNITKLRERYPSHYKQQDNTNGQPSPQLTYKLKVVDFHCPKCKAARNRLIQSGPHIKVLCDLCGAFIKFASGNEVEDIAATEVPWNE